MFSKHSHLQKFKHFLLDPATASRTARPSKQPSPSARGPRSGRPIPDGFISGRSGHNAESSSKPTAYESFIEDSRKRKTILKTRMREKTPQVRTTDNFIVNRVDFKQ